MCTIYECIFLKGRGVWALHASAEYSLFNTSRTKKKPTISVHICAINEIFKQDSSCEIKNTNLKIKLDGKEVDWSLFAKDGHVYARFSAKFGSRVARKVEVSHTLFERTAGAETKKSDAYMIFDYHLEEGAAWDGVIGATYFNIKLPHKADPFNAKIFSKGERFNYKNRLAYFIGRKLNLDGDDGLSFYLTTPSYIYRVKRFKKRVNAMPHSPVRHLALASVLAAYPGAKDAIKDHVKTAFTRKLRKWAPDKAKEASVRYSEYLLELAEFKTSRTPCDETICVEKNRFEEIIDAICSSDRCTTRSKKELNACCSPQGSAESRQFTAENALEEIEDDTEEKIDVSSKVETITIVEEGPDIGAFMLRYAFLLLMAAIGFIGITGLVIFRIKNRNKKTRYEKTLF